MQQRIEKIRDALGLGFSDYFESENVRETTLLDRLDDVERAVEMMLVEEFIIHSLLRAFGHKHPSVHIYAVDFPSDLRASFYLLLGGYYRQAILCLRNWLEMRLVGIYFGLVEQDPSKYQDWILGKTGKEERLFGTGLIAKVFARAEFHKADNRVGLRVHLEQLYSDLSVFTHGVALVKHDLQRDTDNVPGYNATSVDSWFSLLDRTFAEVVFCEFVAYGLDIFSGMTRHEAKTILDHMPTDYEQELRSAMGGLGPLSP